MSGRLGVCALLAVPVVLLGAVPALRFGHWPWICLTLAAPAVVGCAWPVHRGAADGLRRGRVTGDVPAAAGLLTALGWSVATLLTGPDVPGSGAFLDVAAGAAVLVLAARAAGPAPGTGSTVSLLGPVTVAVAVGALGFRLGSGTDPTGALAPSLAVLLAACPAALAAVAPGTGAAFRVRRADTVVLAGAVTRREPVVAGVHPAPGVDAEEALRWAGMCAARSGHPVGRAVAAAARERIGTLPDVAEFDEDPGRGLRGLVAELRGAPPEATVVAHAVLVGDRAWLAEHDVAPGPELATILDEVDAAGQTGVVVAWDGRARAVLALADEVPACDVEALRALGALGLAPVLLHGDERTASADPAVWVGTGGPDGALSAPDLPAAVALLVRLRATEAVRRYRRLGLLGYHLLALPAAAAGLVDPLPAAATATVVAVASALAARGGDPDADPLRPDPSSLVRTRARPPGDPRDEAPEEPPVTIGGRSGEAAG